MFEMDEHHHPEHTKKFLSLYVNFQGHGGVKGQKGQNRK